MKFIKTEIEDVIIIEPDVYADDRGYFLESFNKTKYIAGGIIADFVQDNISKSVKNTVRGLHYQTGEFAQGKLCQVIIGKVLDIAVDIRFGSPTFGKYVSIELNEERHNQIWIPPGFAHGFSVLSDTAVFSYKCTSVYSKTHERSIFYGDKDLKIDWKTDKPLVSDKDKLAGLFSDIGRDFEFRK
ncbi:MAG: dTDP-4-dehydrorhamnose 3,5-epimerase [Ignavibacteria bacterium]|nr:dTDP-4-dehydrorhamnose 3,5-epimerase [Ignavibacteria bacterium]